MRRGLRGLLFGASMFLSVALGGTLAFAQGHGNGHAKGHGNKHDDDDDRAAVYSFSDRDRAAMREWYQDRETSLPPGLAKKDRLPPGMEKQLVERGNLPPGLQKRIQPCPEELERRLPPPPPDCAHVLIGGHLVLLNHRSNVVVAVFHFEIG